MKSSIIMCFLIFISTAHSQGDKSSLAVANPNVEGLSLSSQMASKLIRLELIKMNEYSVYDEFDMAEIIKDSNEFVTDCFGINCLTRMGRQLNVDFILSGSFTGFGNKIAISLKLIDIKSGSLSMSVVREFDDQEDELQRMIEILLYELHGKTPEKELVERLRFKNELITSNNVGRINNSGPRVGYAYLVGSMNEFAKRERGSGGLDIFPGVSMIGYQLEGQYVGTENFSALIEGIVNFTGLEQGVFIPSLTVLNGFRFGKSGWEFAFGPGFGLKKIAKGFFDSDDSFGRGTNSYFSENDWGEYATSTYGEDPQYINEFGVFQAPSPDEFNEKYSFEDQYDSQGAYKLSTNWVFAFGRTFRAGALNIPVNLFYSSSRGGGMAGASVGFNVQNKKKKINSKK